MEGGAEREREKESEADSMLSVKPNMGLDPMSLRSWPEPKAGAKPLRHPEIPI